MKKKHLYLLIISTSMALGAIGLRHYLRPNIADNPATVASIEQGIATINTREGVKRGRINGLPTSGIDWSTPAVRAIVANASIDQVAWREHADGSLSIWFQREAGVVDMAEEINSAVQR